VSYNINIASYPRERRIQILEMLDTHERQVLTLRYGVDNGFIARTLSEVAEILGNGETRESVRRTEARAIQSLVQRGAFDAQTEDA
jgi:DNA-directed RNA polymerase sigma subunit (sigma70/sigma32)